MDLPENFSVLTDLPGILKNDPGKRKEYSLSREFVLS
jgi:hypothetical protein